MCVILPLEFGEVACFNSLEFAKGMMEEIKINILHFNIAVIVAEKFPKLQQNTM